MAKSLNKPFPTLKRVKQMTSSHCGPAVLEMLFSHLGIDISQAAVVRAARVKTKLKKHGMRIDELAIACHKLSRDVQFWYKDGVRIDFLEKLLFEYEYPVGIEWQGIFEDEDDDSGHYSVALDVNRAKDTFTIADPYSKFAGKDRTISLKKFKGRWWDKNLVKKKMVKDHRMLFILTPKEVIFPKALGMRTI